MAVKRITPPVDEPLTVEEMREQIRLVADTNSPPLFDDTAWLLGAVAAARDLAETFTGRVLVPATFELALDAFPYGEIEIPNPPLIAIESVKYVDSDGNQATLPADNYYVDDFSEPAWLLMAYGNSYWPKTYPSVNAIRVRFTAGYSAPADSPQTNPLPPLIRQALLLTIGDFYENRENTVVGASVQQLPMGAMEMLKRYKLNWF